MSTPAPTASSPRRRWTRPPATVAGPNRNFGGYYRTSDRDVGPEHVRGVPLQTAEDAATAAVRLGYRIVDAQITRGLDMARQLRGAADRAGVGAGGEDVFDSAEKLLSRGILLALEWLESAANQPGSPLRRLLAAEFRLAGDLLGLTDPAAARAEPATPRAPDPTPPAPPPDDPSAAAIPRRRVRVRHAPDSDRRAVSVAHWQLDAAVRPGDAPRPLRFHPTSPSVEPALEGTLTLADRSSPVLEITTKAQHPPGRWRGAICESDGEQVGIIEIVI